MFVPSVVLSTTEVEKKKYFICFVSLGFVLFVCVFFIFLLANI